MEDLLQNQNLLEALKKVLGPTTPSAGSLCYLHEGIKAFSGIYSIGANCKLASFPGTSQELPQCRFRGSQSYQSRLVWPQSAYPILIFTLRSDFRKRRDANTGALYTITLRDLRHSSLLMSLYQHSPLFRSWEIRVIYKKCDLTYFTS